MGSKFTLNARHIGRQYSEFENNFFLLSLIEEYIFGLHMYSKQNFSSNEIIHQFLVELTLKLMQNIFNSDISITYSYPLIFANSSKSKSTAKVEIN